MVLTRTPNIEGVNDFRSVYGDSDVTVYLQTALNKVWIHSEFYAPISLSVFKKSKEIIRVLGEEMKKQGFDRLWTTNQTPEQANFAKHLGFARTEDTIAGQPIFYKEL